MNMFRRTVLFSALCAIALTASAAAPDDQGFTIVVVPDTQNAIDYTHQKAAGFAFDAAEIFLEETRDIACRAVTNGGDVVFVAAVGDVWQHLSADMDPDHYARGIRSMPNPLLGLDEDIAPETRSVEIPKAIEGYRILAATGIPFGVVPGNHDYDAVWSSTHDYLNPRGERLPSAITDLALGDPDGNNNAEEIWQKFISANDQILMVFSGHQLGQATRIDANQSGHKVYQMLSDFQSRGQTALDAGQPAQANGDGVPIGDGWYRELNFDFSGSVPTVAVRTWSSHYKAYSSDLPTYVDWYKHIEQPNMSDAEFLAGDEFTLTLGDFYDRFGALNAR